MDALFFTPGSSGTGHLFRFHNLAERLVEAGLRVFSVFGADEVPGALAKVPYQRLVLPRCRYDRFSNAFSDPHLLGLHAAVLANAVTHLKPRLLITSHHWGIERELLPAYAAMACNGNGKVVLAWRDVPDAPNAVAEWVRDRQLFETLREHVDVIAMLGLRDLFDVATAYGLPDDIAAKVEYTGYVAPRACLHRTRVERANELLIAFGGGEHRAHLLRDPLPQLMQAAAALDLRVCIMCGHFWSDADLELLRSSLAVPAIVERFADQGDYLDRVAHARVAAVAGGYNSVVEALVLSVPVVIVASRGSAVRLGEVETRATALQANGLAKLLNAGATVEEAGTALRDSLSVSTQAFDADGAAGFTRMAQRLLQ